MYKTEKAKLTLVFAFPNVLLLFQNLNTMWARDRNEQGVLDFSLYVFSTPADYFVVFALLFPERRGAASAGGAFALFFYIVGSDNEEKHTRF